MNLGSPTPPPASARDGSASACHFGALRVLPADRAWALHDVQTSRAIEARALAVEPEGVLMRRAALAVARWATALAPHADRIWVACGPGGNGGDGLHAASLLARAGRRVSASLHADASRLPPDALAGLEAARAAGVHVSDRAPPDAGVFDLALDALLGLGSRRAPAGAVLEGVRALARVRAALLAIDLPTGLDADTGACVDGCAVQASATLSLLTLKPGLFTAMGRELAGELWFDDLGIKVDPQDGPAAHLIAPSAPDIGAVGVVPHSAHKGTYGDTVIVGGAAGMLGAARLAGHAALGVGCGRTFIVPLDPAAPLRDDLRPELLWRAASALHGATWWHQATVVCGCGGGQAVAAAMPTLLEQASRLVLDADALNALAQDELLRLALRARAGRGGATVLTPHPLEAARLLGCDVAAVQGERLQAAAELAQRFDATVVLKGSGTVVCTPGAGLAINTTGSPALASGGTGDVLAGWLGGLWSRRRAEHTDARALAHAVACAAVWLHGRAAEASAGPVRALDLIEDMRRTQPQAARR